MKDNSDNQFGNDVWIQYHKNNLEVCKQLIKNGRLEPASVILDLMENNLRGYMGSMPDCHFCGTPANTKTIIDLPHTLIRPTH